MRKKYLDQLHHFNSCCDELQNRHIEWFSWFQEMCTEPRSIASLTKYHREVMGWMTTWSANLQTRLSSVAEKSTVAHVIERSALQLKAFLSTHAFLLPPELTDFTLSPFLSAHQVLLLATEMIASEDDVVCQLLMPWVSKIFGVAEETDIKTYTTELDGSFKPWRYVSQHDQNALIPVADYLEYVTTSRDAAARFFSNDALQKMLECKLGITYKNYKTVIQYFSWTAISDSTKFVFYVNRLATALRASSVTQKGREQCAAVGYETEIRNLFNVWRSLPEDVRHQIGMKHVPGDRKYTFLDYLLTVVCHSDNLALSATAEERKLVVEKKILICADQLSSVFFSFLWENPNWANVVVPRDPQTRTNPVDKTVMYTQQDLQRYKNTFLRWLDDLSVRSKTCGFGWMRAIYDSSKNQSFFELIPFLLSSQIENSVLRLLSGDLSQRFHHIDAVFSLLLEVHEHDQRFQIWNGFSSKWMPLFNSIAPIIFLTNLFSEEDSRKIISEFQITIQESLSNTQFHSMKEALSSLCQRLVPAALPDIILQEFILSAVKNHHFILCDNPVFLNCLLACTTEEALEELIKLSIINLTWRSTLNRKTGVCGHELIQLLQYFDKNIMNSVMSGFPFQLKIKIMRTVLQHGLSILFSREKIESFWEKSDSLCCNCFSLFSVMNKKDATVYYALADEYLDCKKSVILSYEKICQIVSIIEKFVREGTGGEFFKTLQTAFPLSMLQSVQTMLLNVNSQERNILMQSSAQAHRVNANLQA